MTVKELIEALKAFDENLIIIKRHHDDYPETFYPELMTADGSGQTYWDDDLKLKEIPANKSYVIV